MSNEPRGQLARYAFGYSDRKPGATWWLIFAAMVAFIVYNAVSCSAASAQQRQYYDGWSCGDEHDNMQGLENKTPKDGGISFCVNCGEFAIIDSSFVDGVRKPTPSENFTLKNNKLLQELKFLWLLRKNS
jgi:hypothetical protein